MKYFLSVLFALFFTIAFSQNDPKQETQRLMDLLAKNEGTYQVQIIDSRELPAIPLSLMDTIIVKRHDTEIKYIWLKDNTRVKILPKSLINDPAFTKLERVVHISSSNLN